MDREIFLKHYCVMLKLPPETTDVGVIAASIINTYKNYETAVAILFDLSWKDHTDWLRACADHLRESWNIAEHGMITSEWLWGFQQYYVTEKAEYPA